MTNDPTRFGEGPPRQPKSRHLIDRAAGSNQKPYSHRGEQQPSWLELVRRKLNFLQSGRERRKKFRQKLNAIYTQNAHNGNDSAILRGLVELYTEKLRKAINQSYEIGIAILANRQLMREEQLLQLFNQVILPQIRGGAAGVRDSLQQYAWRTGVTVADPIYRQALRDAEEFLEELERGWHERIEIEAAELAPQSGSISSAPELSPENTVNSRQAFLQKLLDEKGWSILDWAKESGVDFHTANDYMKGKTNPFKSTRLKLAKSLGIDVNNLPS